MKWLLITINELLWGFVNWKNKLQDLIFSTMSYYKMHPIFLSNNYLYWPHASFFACTCTTVHTRFCFWFGHKTTTQVTPIKVCKKVMAFLLIEDLMSKIWPCEKKPNLLCPPNLMGENASLTKNWWHQESLLEQGEHYFWVFINNFSAVITFSRVTKVAVDHDDLLMGIGFEPRTPWRKAEVWSK